jgi:site-specific recombinase XerD
VFQGLASVRKAARKDKKVRFTALLHHLTVDLASPGSKREYGRSIDDFVAWCCSESRLSFNKTVMMRFRMHLEERHLAPATINLHLAAVRRLAYEASDSGLLSPELPAGIRRVKGAKKLGVRLGNWLTQGKARCLWQLPDAATFRGTRDRALLALRLGCGLRRREVTYLEFVDIQRREDHWAIVDLIGKGGHVRTVPMPDWVKLQIDVWCTLSGVATGKIFRCVCRAGKTWGDRISEQTVWHVVKLYAAKLGRVQIAPHDLRRSCARLCHAAGGELEQIQFLLGHVSVQTTE